jgi:hypothetical protein
MYRLFHAATSAHIVRNSLKISLVVGTILNLINQGDNLFHGESVSWPHLFMNYLTPYIVASYSAAKNKIENQAGMHPQG